MDGKTLYVILAANATAYDSVMDRSGAKTRGFGKDVERAGGNIDGLNDSLADTAVHSRRVSSEIDHLSGRLRLLLDTAALVGPGFLPVLAAGGVAVAGLTSWLTMAALAGGSAVVAFQGVGGAVKAIGEYKVDRTAANLEKVHEQLALLGPDAREFVLAWSDFTPVLRDIRDAGAEGWFPGLTESLDSFVDLAPKVERLFRNVGDAGGDAVADGAASLAGDRWDRQWDFLATEGPQILTQLASIVGDVTHGAGEMMMAFSPGSDDFTEWVGDVADGFDRWASSSRGREDISAFLDYARETGPDVAELFGSLVHMLTQVTQAADPLGGPVLDGLTAVSDVVGAIADSDLGTPIFAGVAAVTAYNRALSITARLQASAFGQKHLPTAGSGDGISGMVASARAGLPTLNQFGTVAYRMGQSSSYASRETLAARDAVRSFTGGLARGAGPVAGFALLTSGMADGIGLTNTASLGLMGTFLGPWGAALGGAAGFALDVKSASDQAGDAITRWNRALAENATSIGGQLDVLADAQNELAAYKADVESAGLGEQISNWVDPDAYANAIEGLFGDSNLEEQEAALARMRREVGLNETAVIKLGQAMGTDVRESIYGGVIDEKVTGLLERARPAMDALGITIEDIYAAAARQDPGPVWAAFVDEGELDRMNHEIATTTEYMDSAQGRSDALAGALAAVGDEGTSTAVAASDLSDALNQLLDPTLNAEEALDGWRASLREMRQELDADIGFDAYGKKAEKNREITRDYVEDSKARLVTLAGLTSTTEADMARAVAQTRAEFIKSGVAAGFSRKEIAARARELGLTPKLVRTIFEAAGIDVATLKAREARKAYLALPQDVRTALRTDGVPKTMAEVNALVERYKLTEKERKALISLQDNASAAARFINNILDNAARDRTATIRTNYIVDRSGTRGMGGPTTEEADGGIWHGGVKRFADGGYGAGGVFYPRKSQIVRGGANVLWGEEETGFEAYISGKPSQRARNVGILGETARRFGMQLTRPGMAANGRYGSELANGGGGGRTIVNNHILPSRLTLVVDGKPMTAFVRGHAGAVLSEHNQVTERMNGAHGRMNWGRGDE